MSEGGRLLEQKQGPVTTLTIHRPEKRNALSPSCLMDMCDKFEALLREDRVSVVVIRGAGREAFSAGYDIGSLPTGDTGARRPDPGEKSPLDLAIESIRHFPYPVIAMVNGYAYGGGCELAVACDIRIAARHARMGVPAAKLGVLYRYRGIRLFHTVLGYDRTLEILLSGRRYDSESCLRMGLVNDVVESDRLEDVTYGLAEEMAENAPLSLRGTKSILNAMARYPVLPQEQIAQFDALRTQAMQSEDMAEGKRAFREKRKPRWKGR